VIMCDPSLGQQRQEAYHADQAIYWLRSISGVVLARTKEP
jgi:hypothetical protein